MKTIKVILSSVLFLFVAFSLNAQDITKAKSKVNSKVLLENDKVRVIEVDSPVGETTAVHSHPDYIIYPLTDTKLEETTNGKTKTVDLKAGEPKYMEAVTHTAKNAGTVPSKVILIELKNTNSTSAK